MQRSVVEIKNGVISQDVDLIDLCVERVGGKVNREYMCKFLFVEAIPVKSQGNVTRLTSGVINVIIFETSSKYAQVKAWCRQSVYAARV